MNLIKPIKRIIPLLGFFLLFYLVIHIGIKKITKMLLLISPVYIIIAASLTLPRLAIRSAAWRMICKAQNIEISIRDAFKFLLIGYLYAVVTPSYAGHLVRIPYVVESTGESSAKIFTNILIEVILRSISLYVLMIIGSVFLFRYDHRILYIISTYVIISVFIYWIFSDPDRGKSILKHASRIVSQDRRKTLYGIIEALYRDFPDVGSLISPLILGGVTWLIAIIQFYIIAVSLGIEIPFHIFLVIYPIASAAGFLPISSGGIGTREATVVFLMGFFGVLPEKSLILSLVGFFVVDFFTGIYGFITSLIEGMKKE